MGAVERGLEIRELECFLVLAEELHFGRTGERLYVSQSRVSQLLAALEQRIGARLVERTSRRVALTPLGTRFLAELRPAYEDLSSTVERARAAARGVEGTLRIGFQGTADTRLMAAIAAFQERHPACTTQILEIPFADPFGAVRRGEVDTAIVLLPVAETELVLGPVFSRERQTVAVSVRHPYARRESVTAAELKETPLIAATAPAPAYWRAAHAPSDVPAPEVRTLQEGLTLVAAGRGAMLLCRPTAEYHGRKDVVFVPVDGLPDSVLGMVWHRDGETARVREFAHALRTC
ncbi:LysR family transcriptional regulator [Streptomyces alfalfae]|uniref:Transcriptional regulator n=2 Tax=Streptomyces alfalfae TaxID=1642299 RepID=A0ABM6GW15_9ACTN|nr:LysR family transcriptional regulator [Streptomyces alfalfae]APY88308.1 transcriptional regulator [Streptomyces alfalfae]AYA18711.1 LysR family transcriptional regulator [Streptomyces fradiae]RXX46410.1 LysR family transcriptional regulator [Streptomyces alfalfae]RZM93499.1 LysR family transcriptional regulator [Streptomyces alfalfae]